VRQNGKFFINVFLFLLLDYLSFFIENLEKRKKTEIVPKEKWGGAFSSSPATDG